MLPLCLVCFSDDFFFLSSNVNRQAEGGEDASQQNSEVGESWDSPSEEEEALYSTSPPCTPRQMKRMSGKHQRNSQARSAGRSPNKSKFQSCAKMYFHIDITCVALRVLNVCVFILADPSPSSLRESPRPVEPPEEHSYKQGKKHRATLRSTERDHKKTFEGSFMLDPLSKSSHFGALNMDPRKHYLSLGCSSCKLPVSMPHMARTHRQTSRTDCPADRLKFFETLRLLLKLTSMSSKRKEKEQRGLENMAFMGHNNEVIWLELQAWHARRTTNDQDLYLFTARQAIPDIINEVLHFKVNYASLKGAQCPKAVDKDYQSVPDLVCGEGREPAVAETNHCGGDPSAFGASPSSAMNAAEPLGSGVDCREHLQRQRLAFEQVKRVMELLESVEALYPSLQALQKDYEKYAARDFQGRVQALCLWLNITQDLNQKLRIMATVLGLHDLSRIGWPVFEIPSPRCSRGHEDDENDEDENDSTATFTAESDGEDRDAEEELGVLGHVAEGEVSPSTVPKFSRLFSEEFLPTANAVGAEGGGDFCPTAIYRPFVDKALKQMGLRKLILRLHKLMDRSLQRSRAALLHHTPIQEVEPSPLLLICFH